MALIVALLGAGQVAISAAQPWDAQQTLSTGSLNDSPQMVMSADGLTVLSVWKSGSSIVVRRSTDGGLTWDAPATLAGDAEASTSPQIAASRDAATATVVWERADNTLRSRSTTDSGASWSPTVAITSENTSAAMVAASADGQRLTVAWWRLAGADNVAFAQTSTDSGSTWGLPTAVSAGVGDAAFPRVASSADGMLLTVAWSPFAGGELRAASSIDGGVTWEPNQAVNPIGGLLTDLTAAADGRATVVWQKHDGTRNRAYAATRRAGDDTWSPAVQVSTDRTALNPQVVSSAQGARLVAGWNTDDGRLQVTTSAHAGAAWSEPQDLTLSYAGAFELASSRAGMRLLAVWLDAVGSVRAATSQDAGLTWTSAEVAPGPGTPFSPKAALSSDGGTAAALWHRDTSGSKAVHLSRASVAVSRFTAASLHFGQQETGFSSSRVVTVTNAGPGPLIIDSVAITGAGFGLTSQTCTAGPVASGGTCTATVSFAPATPGGHTGVLRFIDNSDDGFDEVAVTGDAFAPAPPTPPPVPPPTSPVPTGSATPTPSPTTTMGAVTTLRVTARKARSVKAGKRIVLVSGVSTNGTPTIRVTCSRKRDCGVKVVGTKVSVKPACRTGLRVTVVITASSPAATSATWTRRWKVKPCRV